MQNNRTFPLLLTLLACLALNPRRTAAQEMEGSVRYLITHDWTKKMAAVDYISKQQRERIAYMWGGRSEWKTYANLHFNATESRYEDSEERAEPDDEGYSWRKDLYQIKRDFGKNTIYEAMTLLGKNYIVEDSLRASDWKILNDLKEVAGHICMKAYREDTLKQQKIVAWFATDMPVSFGPERFCGLPGLILEVDVNNGGMIVSADRIELKKLDKELDLPKKIKGKKITEAEYFDILREHMTQRRKEEEPPFWGIRY
jgi:GLPGLI family protein